jgi:hypothetical protein
LKLIDFGWACSNGNGSTILSNKKIYTSPELSQTGRTPQSDIYAFGIVCCEWFCDYMTADKLYDSETDLLESLSHMKDKLKRIADSHEISDLYTLVMQCLNSDSEQRPTASILIDQFKKIYSQYSNRLYANGLTNYLKDIVENRNSMQDKLLGLELDFSYNEHFIRLEYATDIKRDQIFKHMYMEDEVELSDKKEMWNTEKQEEERDGVDPSSYCLHHNNVVILGIAASGKSCLLLKMNYDIALTSLRRLKPLSVENDVNSDSIQRAKIRIPVFVSLHEMYKNSIKNFKKYVKYMYPALVPVFKENRQSFLFLADGLDEIQETVKRSKYVERIVNECKKSGISIVVSSRETGFFKEYFEHFSILIIKPLSEYQQSELMKKRLRTLFYDSRTQASMKKLYNSISSSDTTMITEPNILEVFKKADSILDKHRTLFQTPLSISLFLKCFKEKVIDEPEWNPATKFVLYDDFIDMTFKTRDHIPEKVRSLQANFRLIMEHLSHRLCMQKTKTFDFQFLQEYNTSTIENRDPRLVDGYVVLQTVLDEYLPFIPLFVSVDGKSKTFMFTHLTFQEYLCARYIEKDLLAIPEKGKTKFQSKHLSILKVYLSSHQFQKTLIFLLCLVSVEMFQFFAKYILDTETMSGVGSEIVQCVIRERPGNFTELEAAIQQTQRSMLTEQEILNHDSNGFRLMMVDLSPDETKRRWLRTMISNTLEMHDTTRLVDNCMLIHYILSELKEKSTIYHVLHPGLKLYNQLSLRRVKILMNCILQVTFGESVYQPTPELPDVIFFLGETSRNTRDAKKLNYLKSLLQLLEITTEDQDEIVCAIVKIGGIESLDASMQQILAVDKKVAQTPIPMKYQIRPTLPITMAHIERERQPPVSVNVQRPSVNDIKNNLECYLEFGDPKMFDVVFDKVKRMGKLDWRDISPFSDEKELESCGFKRELQYLHKYICKFFL